LNKTKFAACGYIIVDEYMRYWMNNTDSMNIRVRRLLRPKLVYGGPSRLYANLYVIGDSNDRFSSFEITPLVLPEFLTRQVHRP
jgi:hypothetical protein